MAKDLESLPKGITVYVPRIFSDLENEYSSPPYGACASNHVECSVSGSETDSKWLLNLRRTCWSPVMMNLDWNKDSSCPSNDKSPS